MTAVTDDELMLSCRDGAQEAFDALFDRYRSAIWGFFRRRIADPSRAEDLTQETFVALLTSVSRYEPRGAFRRYLFGIAYHVLSDERRRASTTMSDIDLATIPAAGADLDDVLRVRRAVADLDAIDRDVVMLREFEALSYVEIADVLSVPINTVRSRLFRARMALKEKLL